MSKMTMHTPFFFQMYQIWNLGRNILSYEIEMTIDMKVNLLY